MMPPQVLLSLSFVIVLPLSLDAALLTCRIELVDGMIKKVCRKLECPVDCSNGVCDMYLKRCICHAGYEWMNGKCMPVCEVPVCEENEHCTEPNKCSCKEGFMRNDGQCQPVCDTGCGESKYCAAPNSCICKNGYTAAADGSCEPICPTSCGNHGRCKSPSICECDENYSVEAGGECTPICDKELCAHADCIEPYKCICHEGYSLNFENGKCEPLQDNTRLWIDVRFGADE